MYCRGNRGYFESGGGWPGIRTHVKCPLAPFISRPRGPRWRRRCRRRCCRCRRRRLTIGDSPGSAAASFPCTTTTYTPLRAYKSSDRPATDRMVCGSGGWRRYARAKRARSVYYSKLLSATTVPATVAAAWSVGGGAPPPAVADAVASRTPALSRLALAPPPPPKRTRDHSAEWNAVDVVPRFVCVRRSCTPLPYARDTLHLRCRHLDILVNRITAVAGPRWSPVCVVVNAGKRPSSRGDTHVSPPHGAARFRIFHVCPPNPPGDCEV